MPTLTKDKKISLFQEKLVQLYLRLNGYFSTGFIIQSDQNARIKTEVDIIAIRFPLNEQTEREVPNSSYLKIPDGIDIIVGEVKMRKAALHFNDPLRVDNDRYENWKKMLKWIGLFSEDDLQFAIPELIQCVGATAHSSSDFYKVERTGTFGRVNIRPIMFAPDRPKPRDEQQRYVYGNEIIEFIWNCLNPNQPRKLCATNYTVDVWGEFMDIVEYFKKRHKAGSGICTMKDLYTAFVS